MEKPSHLQWIEYKGKKILFTDCRYMTEFELQWVIRQSMEYVSTLDNKDVRILANMENSEIPLHAHLEFEKLTPPHARPALKKMAIVGLKGKRLFLSKTLHTLMHRGAKPFSSEEKAKKWLAH